MSSFAVVLPAAGKSSRFADDQYKKPFIPLNGKAVWLYAAEAFLRRCDVQQLIVVVNATDRDMFLSMFCDQLADPRIVVVDGGAERCDSVRNALASIDSNIDYIAIHDAARPCIDDSMIERVFQAAVSHQAATMAVPVTSTLKYSEDGTRIDRTVSRSHLYESQTPQVFAKSLLEHAYQQLTTNQVTDDAQVMELANHPVQIVTGSPLNIKITSKSDLDFCIAALQVINGAEHKPD